MQGVLGKGEEKGGSRKREGTRESGWVVGAMVFRKEVCIHRAGPVSRVTKMTIHRASPVSNKNDYTQGRPCVKHRAESIS